MGEEVRRQQRQARAGAREKTYVAVDQKMSDDTHTENVHSVGVAFLTKDLRGHVSWFASNMGGGVLVCGKRAAAACGTLLLNVVPDKVFADGASECDGRAKVRQGDVAVVVDENVVGFEVVVDDASLV